jgi:prefoldin subunit 5
MPKGEVVEHLRSQLDALSTFTGELERRLSDAGVQGVDGALDFYRRLRTALDGVPTTEIDRLQSDVDSLARELGEIRRRLNTLRQLKELIGI